MNSVTEMTPVETPKATRREWIGLAVLATRLYSLCYGPDGAASGCAEP